MPRQIAFPLLTNHFEIRPLRDADAEALLAVYGDQETMQFLATDLPTTVDAAREWVQAKMQLHDRTGLSLWAVVERETGTVVGDAGLQVEGPSGDIGLGGRLNRRYWRRGYGLEVGRALLDAAFEQT